MSMNPPIPLHLFARPKDITALGCQDGDLKIWNIPSPRQLPAHS